MKTWLGSGFSVCFLAVGMETVVARLHETVCEEESISFQLKRVGGSPNIREG